MITRIGFLASLPVLAATQDAIAQTTTKLRIGAGATDGYGEAYYAQDMGFFQKAGLAVEIYPFSNSGKMAAAIIGGSLDVAVTNPISLANAYLRKLSLVYIAGGLVYRIASAATAFCVAKNSPIKVAKDFEGQTISVNDLGAPTHLAVLAWLANNGADISKVKIIELPALQTGGDLARGLIAGAMIPEPAKSAIISSGDARLFCDPFDMFGDNALLLGWVAALAWVNKSPDVAERFAAVIHSTGRWANANQEQSGRILQKYSHISDATLSSMVRAVYATSLEPAAMDSQLRLAAQYKFTSRLVNSADLCWPSS